MSVYFELPNGDCVLKALVYEKTTDWDTGKPGKFLYLLNRGTEFNQKFTVKQMPAICDTTLVPKSESISEQYEYEVDGKGKQYNYTDFFIDNKALGCELSNCTIVDQNGGKCDSHLTGTSVQSIKTSAPWTILA